MSNLDKATFFEQAKKISLESFWAYFVENNMSKSCINMPPERFKSFCIDKLHNHVDYKDFLEYILPTTEYEHSAYVEDVQTQAPFATEELCVVFLTAKVFFVIDNGYKIQYNIRISYIVTQNKGKLEILHLHFSMPHKNIRNIHLHNQYEQIENNYLYINPPIEQATKGAATAVGMYSPNGLIFYQISGKEQVNLVNEALYKLLGYTNNRDLLEHTQGKLERLVAPQDWPRVHKQLAKREPGKVFNMNASFLRKDGSSVRVLLRGNYVEEHNQFYILSLTPLLLPDEQLASNALLATEKADEDYSISYELFLKIALDIFVQYGRDKGIPHLLELATTVLNAHNGSIFDVRDLQAPIKLVLNYTTSGYKKILPLFVPARCSLYWTHRFTTFKFDKPENMPEPLHSIYQQQGIYAWMFQIITVNGKESFIINFLRQKESKPWTENEVKIMNYTAKMFALLLEDYAKKNPVQSVFNGGAL